MKRILLLSILIILVAIFFLNQFNLPKNSGVVSSGRDKKLIILRSWQSQVTNAYSEPQFFLTNLPPTVEFTKLNEVNLQIHSIRANLTPEVVELLRYETNAKKIFELDYLLEFVCSISLRKRGQPDKLIINLPHFQENALDLKRQFLSEWDSNLFNESDSEIAKLISGLSEMKFTRGGIDFRTFSNISFYGIYAIPSLLKEIKQSNSRLAFIGFLFIAQHSSYGRFEDPQLPQIRTNGEHLKLIHDWWSREHTKFNELHPLYEKIDVAVKALPNLPVETNAVASGSSP